MSNAPDSVLRLVERFERNADAYHAGGYGETQVRVEFIDPLFIALGWDVHNRSGYAQAYKDVVHEDAIKVGGSTKAPDYCFRIGGTRKFFLEAKKPSVDIAAEAHPAYQLRRYAWSAKLPLSILTDFEEFAVYDCRVRPGSTDKPSVGRVKYLTCREYDERWDEIAAVFSKQAVLQGSFDKYVAGKKKRGTAEVDAEFLKDIETWRSALARNIALRNPTLDRRQLNVAVQRIIDRIIFLRICEDRGVEKYASLQALINGPEVYARLMQMFRTADDRYNSGLFHFNPERGRPADPDTLTPTLKIDDKVLKDVFRSLYYPQSPYEFSVLPADILGNVYEQFLGKVIHLTPGRRVRVEEKPEVKKAGGVYYTPRYIVDYIVEHTVGKLIESKTPRQINRMRVLDPACGSGSFLIGAYRKLLNYHRDWYLDENNGGPKKHTKQIYQGAGGQWYLTTAEKKRILLNNIYGVDIDPQAVEVSKLNLLLCVLENENQNTLSTQLKIFHERALPDLSNNIKCGNSLIGPDFYEGKQLALFDEETRYRVNAFDWKAEFPEIFKGKTPGFDAVIGNPPYVNIRILTQVQVAEVKEYFRSKYRCAHRGYDIYVLFVEKAHELLRTDGRFGMIVPNKIATLDYAYEVRKLLIHATAIMNIADVSHLRVFSGASVYPYILIWEKRNPTGKHVISVVHAQSVQELISMTVSQRVAQHSLSAESGITIHGSLDVEARVRTSPLSERARLDSGTTGFAAHEMANHLIERKKAGRGNYFDFIVSGNIDRFVVHRRSVRFMKQYFHRPVLATNSSNLTANKIRLFRNPKIVVAGMTKRLEAAYDPVGLALGVSVYAVSEMDDDPKYILGLLNSKLMSHLFRLRFRAKHLAGGFLAINKGQLGKLPIRIIDFADTDDKNHHDRIISLVNAMLSLQKQLAGAKTEHDKTLIQRQIDATDNQIDKLVYGLYGLTDEEIRIVEGDYGKQQR